MRLFPIALTFLAVVLSPSSAAAQCGAGASECVGCHEGRAERPVSADGTPWHADHAFGDFCAICHGGDPAAKDAATAHASLFAPLDHAADACGSCHGAATAGLSERYATARVARHPPSAPPGVGGIVLWRNLALAAFVVVLGVGGGAYVARHERALRGGPS